MIINQKDPNSILQAVKILNSGGVIAFATDTIYGIACDANNEKAVKKLYKLKKRDEEKAIAVFVKDLDIARKIAIFDDLSLKIANKFLPGALTLILPKKDNNKISNLVNKNNQYIGIRIPNHEFSLKLLEKFSGILAVTSANIADQKPAENILQIQQYFLDDIDLIIDAGVLENKSSTIVKVNNDKIQILREGLITQEEILKI